MEEKNKEIVLIVEDIIRQSDFGRGVVRIDPEAMNELGIKSGSYVRLTGSRVTVARALPSVPMDYGTRLIRMDKLIKGNAGVKTGDKVRVKKEEIVELSKVVLAPQDKMVRFGADFPKWAKSKLMDMAVTRGDLVYIPTFQKFVPLIVVSTSPRVSGRIGQETVLEIKEQPAEMEKVEVPMVTYSDIGGLKEAIQRIKEMVELPLKKPELFRHLGIEPPKGVLLYGPPGTGKTLLAKAVANESGANFISVKGPEIMSKWVGESEKAIREIFRKARQVAPCIIFIDEIDSVFPRRGAGYADSGVTERVVSQMLTEIDGIQALKNVIVIGATNRPDLLDPAILRPGRLEKLIYVPPPDLEGRHKILKVLTRKVPLAKDVDLMAIALRTNGFSGADLAALVREAALNAMRENIDADKVSMRHFESALEVVKPSLTEEILNYFEEVKKAMRAIAQGEQRSLGYMI